MIYRQDSSTVLEPEQITSMSNNETLLHHVAQSIQS